MSTPWDLLRAAHGEHGPASQQDAYRALIDRYRRAAYRYLLGAVRDVDTAEELFQEFAFRLVRGDFRNADPLAGRFRDYLRTALSHLINDHRRRRRRQPASLPDDVPAAPDASLAEADDAFLRAWRAEMLNQAWGGLKAENPTQYAVLYSYLSQPEQTAPEAAKAVSDQLGRPLTPVNLRVLLHRARQRFAELVLERVAETMVRPTRQELAEELRALNLGRVCRRALKRWPEPEPTTN